jgi:hypothetical protein
MFHPVYGDACLRWHADIDTEEWPDASSHEKDINFLIYDKIRWNHEKLAQELLQPIRAVIERRGSEPKPCATSSTIITAIAGCCSDRAR